MTETLATLFARLGKDTPIDAALLKRIHQYERAFVNKDQESVEFFGGQLMGVNTIRFRTQERDEWFTEVIRVDELELRDGILTLPTIDSDWKRASDAMNLSCVWILHSLYKADLTVAEKHAGMVDTLLILQYKFLASLMAHYYPYPAKRSTMEAVYASLSRRYALKVAGSWNRLLRSRAEEIISPTGIHKNTYQKFNNDLAIGNMVADIQGRLRKIIKTMTARFYETIAEGGGIGTAKSILEIDGQTVLKDKTRQFSSYIRYAHLIADDPRDFIRKELIDVVADIQHTIDPRRLEEALEWMCVNHRVAMPRWTPKVESGYVEHFMDEVLLHAFSLISHKSALISSRSGLAPLLAQLRALYMASRMADPALLQTKEMADRIVESSIHSRNASVAASVRTGIQLYIVLRAMTKDHYS